MVSGPGEEGRRCKERRRKRRVSVVEGGGEEGGREGGREVGWLLIPVGLQVEVTFTEDMNLCVENPRKLIKKKKK